MLLRLDEEVVGRCSFEKASKLKILQKSRNARRRHNLLKEGDRLNRNRFGGDKVLATPASHEPPIMQSDARVASTFAARHATSRCDC